MTGINLDAILGETEAATRPLTYRGQEFSIPGELPGSVLAPFLADDFGLIDLIVDVLAQADDEAEWDDLLIEALKAQPKLPLELIAAIGQAFKNLIGEAQYDAFLALNPSVPAWFALAQQLVKTYGVSISDFFGSLLSSETGGEPSKESSSGTTESTSGASSEPAVATPIPTVVPVQPPATEAVPQEAPVSA